MKESIENSKWVLTRTLHLGKIGESFIKGSVIEYNESEDTMTINGRLFDETSDFKLLLSQRNKNPENPWILPWTEDIENTIKEESNPNKSKKDPKNHYMPIIEDDSTVHEFIDIRSTKTASNERPKKDPNAKMEVIRGEVTIEERLAELKDRTDIASIEERTSLKMERWNPKIVNGDRGEIVQGLQDEISVGFKDSEKISIDKDLADKIDSSKDVSDDGGFNSFVIEKLEFIEEKINSIIKKLNNSDGNSLVSNSEISVNDSSNEVSNVEVTKPKSTIRKANASNNTNRKTTAKKATNTRKTTVRKRSSKNKSEEVAMV